MLVGGGHAHLEVLRALARNFPRGAEVVLVSPSPEHHYSSMVPGFLQQQYAEPELAFDLPALCRAAGARFVEAPARRVDGAARTVELDGATMEFDVASLDVGSDPAGLDVPGARVHAHAVRPMSRCRVLADALAALAADAPGESTPVCVVGGGAAGAEIAWAVHRRLARAGHRPHVTLVEREPQLLPQYAAPARRRARALLEQRGERLVVGGDVAAVARDAVTLAGGEQVASSLTVWLTGAAPNEVVRRSALAKDPRGFVLVDAGLRDAGGAPVWGAGDCVTPASHPDTPKAGVYAVREAPVLAENLRAACEGRPATRRYVPQSHFLAILNTGDGRALLRWHGVLSHSRAAWRLKDWIDRRYVRRYQRLYERAP